MDDIVQPQSLSLATLIDALNRELNAETEDTARSLRWALELIRDGTRGVTAGEQLRASPSSYE